MSGRTRLLYMLIALLCSLLLWFYVVGIENPIKEDTIDNIPVTFVGETEIFEDYSLIITSDRNLQVSLKVSGNMINLTALNGKRGEITATVDVSRIKQAGTHRLTVEYSLPVDTVTILDRTVLVDVTVEKQQSRPVEVRLKNEGTLAEDYLADPAIVEPETIQISGSEELINRVAYAEVVWTRENVERTLELELEFLLYDSEGNVVDKSNISTNVEFIKVTLPVYMVKEVPLTVEIAEGGGATAKDVEYILHPSTVEIAGDAAQLEAINYITVGTIDLSKIRTSAKPTFDIIYPNDVRKISGEETCEVDVEIVGLEIKTFYCDNIELMNKPNSYDIEIITNQIAVDVRGKTADLETISDHNLRARADLSGADMSVGKYSVKVTLTIDGNEENSKIGVVGEYNIVIEVSKR